MSVVVFTGSTTLRELDLWTNDIGDNGISMITEWLLSNKTLTKLNVSGCNLSMKGTVVYKIYRIAQNFARGNLMDTDSSSI